ncbi:MAG TPA: proline dehydrogenase family protein, partial [Azospirillum sp.]|nr:proline dehydrogenase family protein [Azospirillum sp.]
MSAAPQPAHPHAQPLDRSAIHRLYRADEAMVVTDLVRAASLPEPARRRVQAEAARLVEGVRAARTRFGALDAFLQEFGLSTQEGVALMCLAEALLRIPDAETADALIRDKIGTADWNRHLGKADSLFVNASTWALMLTGKVVNLDGGDEPTRVLDRLVGRVGEPIIRQAMMQAMRILGRQFVLGRTIDEALGRARDDEKLGYNHSFDMLGEAARTFPDADRYHAAYAEAIRAVGKVAERGHSISVKLSALHPRYETAQYDRCVPALIGR